jgi:methionyl-tRNA formyltransferase
MSENKRIVVWCGDAANQKALANKIAAQFNLCGIVIDKKKNFKKKSLLKKLVPALQDRLFFKKIIQAWTSLQHNYTRQYPQWPDTKQIAVDSINTDEAFDFTQQLSPDLVVVSGTGLVKSKMLSLKPEIGIINLHTGLSPYIKGGPNCTNWCIATGQYEKVGNTIMWINEGIDAGNIITSELTSLQGVTSLEDIQWKVMEHAHELYLRAIHYLLSTSAPYASVAQDKITTGKLYLTRMWNFAAKRKLLVNLPSMLKKLSTVNDASVVTVPIKPGNQ